MDADVETGIIIGGAGGAIAGITVWLINLVTAKINELHHKRKIYNWLYNRWLRDVNLHNSTGKKIPTWHSTKMIASYTNLTEDRVRYICSTHNKISQSIGDNEDMWGITEIARAEENQKEGKS